MYVRRKRRFVRRKDSLGGSANSFWVTHTTGGYTDNHQRMYKTLTSLALVLAIVVAIPLVALTLKPMQVMMFHVDPELQEALMLGKPVDAYVTVKSNTDLGLKPIRVWSFGDIKIVKVRLTSTQQLYGLIHRPGVISIYAAKKFRHAPLYYLDVMQYEKFREVDIDNEFHKAYGHWIGRNVTVAIIDTGIDYTHPDFYDEYNRSIIKVLVSMFYVSATTGEYIFWEPYKNGTMEDLLDFDMQLWQQYGEPAFLDINGHGTHVAGIIAGRGWASDGKYKGIAPGVKLVIIKAFDKDGTASMDSCLEALEWVYNNTEKYDIKILSLSWGAAFASDGKDPMSMAANKVAEKGVWVFAAAGNEGNIPTTIVVPAVAEKVFAIGAWDPYYDKVAPFSSLGPTVDLRMKPDFMGAGVMIVSCKSTYVDFPDEYEVGNYYVALSGTSMSTPAVAAVAADFIEYFRYWHHRDPTVNEFLKWVEDNARHINFVKDFLTGWGIPVAPHS